MDDKVHCRFLGNKVEFNWVHKDRFALYNNERGMRTKLRPSNVIYKKYRSAVREVQELMDNADNR